jgi:predicted porin
MKKSLLALAVLGAFSSLASAQSSVTLSGTVDAGVRYTKEQYSLGGSQSAYNSFTISGREDLGGGMTAFFVLNHRFSINNGQVNSGASGSQGNGTPGAAPTGTPPFWRNSFVGLGSAALGDVRLGRMLMPLQDMNGGFDAWDTGTVGSVHTGGITATVRANNAIYYRSPSFAGFTLHAAIAAGEGQSANENIGGIGTGVGRYYPPFPPSANMINGERPMGASIRYAAGPANFGAAYDVNTFNQETWGVYGAWNFGFMTLMGQYESGDNAFNGSSQTNVYNTENVDVWSISAKIPMGAFVFKAGYAALSGKTDGTKWGLGGDYFLSKRTNLYANVGQLGGDRFNSPKEDSVAFDIGVTHRF